MANAQSPSIKGTVIGSWLFLFLSVSLLLVGITMAIGRNMPAVATAETAMQSLQQFQSWYAVFQKRIWFWGIPAIGLVAALWALWFHGAVRRRIANQPTQKEKRTKTPAPLKDKQEEKPIPARDPDIDKRLFLYLVGMLQREGRLLDFFNENLEDYEDAQIGAAVRNIHENCRKIVDRYLPLQPVVSQEEGEAITLQANFDAAAIKLVGQVGDHPPFTGVVRHRGWRVKKVVLPELSGNPDPDIIAAAEVEIS
ncbi:DUF2760 domain-containing protein [Desulfatirhabdium butyrativorans]|uniref:DUF2760 domain-containing protein n=1 Tax=Desulfatirhabdium butyrativorans TaxID=340467 RepID=UPI0003F88973|nr:DUF2760 domain-containing protein [Desulfatirhabdium butyrativorans]